MSVPEKHIGARTSNIKGRPETPTVSNRRACPYCRGLGKTVVRQEWHADGRPKKTECQICSWCHGRGWLPADGFEVLPPGTISVGDYTARLRHPFSIGYSATPSRGDDPRHDLNCDVFPVHQEFDRDMIEIKSAGGLMIPKALIEDARDGKGLLDVIRENMVKAQVEKNEEMAARVLAKRKTVAELAQDLYPTYGAFAEELARSIKAGTPLRKAYAQIKDRGQRMHDLSKALASCAPLANVAGQKGIPDRRVDPNLRKRRMAAGQRRCDPLAYLYDSPRDDELTALHALTRWERPDDDWEGISSATKRRILSARRRRALKDKIRPRPADRRSRALKDKILRDRRRNHVRMKARESRGIPSWDKDKGQEQ